MERTEIRPLYDRLMANMETVIKWKSEVIGKVILCLLCGGHILLEDLPGTGKTTLIKALSKSLDCRFTRVQFTPDLLPSDLTGAHVYSQKTGEFTFRPGPVFTNLLLADEINRATPRTQSSLLECMEEGQVSIDGETMKLSQPFFVAATQNPIEIQGTFPLPEAQLDRFFMRVSIGYPTADEEADILERYTSGVRPLEKLEPICSSQDILKLQQQVEGVYAAKEVRVYIAAIAAASRKTGALELGVSTRAAIALLKASQARALMDGRDYVLPEDVQRMAEPVLAHRLVLSPEARMRNMTPQKVLSTVLSSVPVPVKTK